MTLLCCAHAIMHAGRQQYMPGWWGAVRALFCCKVYLIKQKPYIAMYTRQVLHAGGMLGATALDLQTKVACMAGELRIQLHGVQWGAKQVVVERQVCCVFMLRCLLTAPCTFSFCSSVNI
jgi:hypothetical protein